jgi:nucleoside-diphosphate-sugar epimerase
MNNLIKNIKDVEQLENMLSTPSQRLVEFIKKLKGDILILGVGGKIGPSLAQMAKRASDEAGMKKRIIGVSLFESEDDKKKLEAVGIETIHGDLLDRDFLSKLPKMENVIFMAGMKFGLVDNLSLTWAINSYLPALVAEEFKDSKIVAFSTGCVYPLVPVSGGGSTEKDKPEPIGEYAQSCLGRERMFEYGSSKYKTPAAIIRLNYAIDMRYGVLVDIAQKVKNNQPVDVTMGFANMIWQGDANDMILRSLGVCEFPAKILNVTGPETVSIRWVVKRFGELMNKKVEIVGLESETALLGNASLCHRLFGYPKVTLDQMIVWIADWVQNERESLNKPTHFEVRDGKY